MWFKGKRWLMYAKPKRLTIARLKDDHDSNAFNNPKKFNLTLSLQILFPNLCHLTMSSPSLGQTSQTAYSGSQWSAIGNRVMLMSPTEFRR